MSAQLSDLAVPPAGALLVAGMSWLWGRSIRRGQPLTRSMRLGILYVFLFCIGTGYFMMAGSWLGWPRWSLVRGRGVVGRASDLDRVVEIPAQM